MSPRSFTQRAAVVLVVLSVVTFARAAPLQAYSGQGHPASAKSPQQEEPPGQKKKASQNAVQNGPTSRLDERVMVVGSAENLEIIPGSATRIEGAALLRAQGAFSDIHRILRSVPGVNIQEEDGFGLRPNIGLRGSGAERSARITLMEDGVLIAPAPYAAPAAYYFPTAGRMEAIEVRKGSSQIKFGPRTNGGALNLVSTRVPDALRIRGDLGGGSNATAKARLSVGSRSRNWGWLLETYQIRTNGFKQIDGGGGAGFRLSDLVGKARYRSTASASSLHEIELKVGLTDQGSDETYLGLTDADFAANPLRRYAGSQQDRFESRHRQLQLRYSGTFGESVDLTTIAYRNDFGRDWYKTQSVHGISISKVLGDPLSYAGELAILRGTDSAADAIAQRHNNRDYYGEGIQTVLGLRLGDGSGRHELEIGARYHADQEDRFQSEDGFQMLAGQKRRTSIGPPGSQSNRVSGARAAAFFAQDRFHLGRLAVTPGLRFETIGMGRTDYSRSDPQRLAPARRRRSRVNILVPGVGLDYRVGERSSVFTGVHRGFAPPGPGAADGVAPETSVNYELGYRYRSPHVAAGVTGFFNDYTNLLGADTLSGGGQGTGDQFNGGAARVWGIEASSTYEVAALFGSRLRLPIGLTYTWTRGQFLTSFESDFEAWGSVRAGDRLPYLPEHQLHGSVGVEAPRWNVYAELTVGSAMRTVAGQGPIPTAGGTDAFTVFDLSAGLRVRSDLRLTAAVQNLLDNAYIVARRPAGARPGLPRTIVVGLSFMR